MTWSDSDEPRGANSNRDQPSFWTILPLKGGQMVKEPTAAPDGRRLKGRVSQADVPRHSISEARRVAQVIEDHYGGKSASPLDVATSVDSTPSSSWFRTVT